MDDTQNDTSSYFTTLPLEIRNLIYTHLIASSTIHSHPPTHLRKSWQSPSSRKPQQIDLYITSDRVIFRNLHFTLIYPLLTTNHQIHEEVSACLYAGVKNVKIVGDFLFQGSNTARIFDMLERRRVWLERSVRSVEVELKVFGPKRHLTSRGEDNGGGLPTNPEVRDYLGFGEKRCEVPVGRSRAGELFVAEKTWLTSLVSKMEDVGFETIAMIRRVGAFAVSLLQNRKKFQVKNTLPRLAKMLENFVALENIGIETKQRQLFEMFPDLIETAKSFVALRDRGVEVNVLLRMGQSRYWETMLLKNGQKRENIKLWHENRDEPEAFDAWRTDGSLRRYNFVAYRLLDCLDGKKK